MKGIGVRKRIRVSCASIYVAGELFTLVLWFLAIRRIIAGNDSCVTGGINSQEFPLVPTLVTKLKVLKSGRLIS